MQDNQRGAGQADAIEERYRTALRASGDQDTPRRLAA